MSTGSRIKRYRKAAGLTQKQLGEAIGLGESAVRNYERDIRTPKKDQLDAMAEAMDIAPEALYDIDANNAREALEVLFRLEGTLGLKPVETKDGIAVAVSPDAPGAQKSAAALKAWKRMRDDLEAGDVSEDDYERWKASFKV
ncbi:MAG: helix-turn-helix domain-containing protein [Coriobacteriales bacterium]